MTVAEFTPMVLVTALLAGFIGSLTGLGGGVIVTPVLTLFLGVDIRYAIGASLVSVIATSSGAAAAYVRDGYSSIRIGMFLEIATTFGADLRRIPWHAHPDQRSEHRFRADSCCRRHGRPAGGHKAAKRRCRPILWRSG